MSTLMDVDLDNDPWLGTVVKYSLFYTKLDLNFTHFLSKIESSNIFHICEEVGMSNVFL